MSKQSKKQRKRRERQKKQRRRKLYNLFVSLYPHAPEQIAEQKGEATKGSESNQPFVQG